MKLIVFLWILNIFLQCTEELQVEDMNIPLQLSSVALNNKRWWTPGSWGTTIEFLILGPLTSMYIQRYEEKQELKKVIHK